MFDIVTSRDFLSKLEADFADFENEPHSTRLAVNCALTAYHLHEWVWGDWLKARKVFKTKDDFLAWIDSACPWFETIQELANGAKHFRASEQFKTERVGAPPFMFDELGAGFDEGAWDGPMPYVAESHGNGYLLIDYGEGIGPHRWKTAAALLDVVVRFWRESPPMPKRGQKYANGDCNEHLRSRPCRIKPRGTVRNFVCGRA